MRKLVLSAVMCALLFACGKKSNPGPPSSATVEYRFTVVSSASFRGTYLNAKSVAADTGFVGTTFSKTIKVTRASGFTFADMSFEATDPSVSGSGTIYILVNGSVVLQQYFDYNAQRGFEGKAQVF